MLKVSTTEYCYKYYIYNTDWLWAPFYRDGPFIKNVSLDQKQKMLFIQYWWIVPLEEDLTEFLKDFMDKIVYSILHIY